jgi:hypothetical protein
MTISTPRNSESSKNSLSEYLSLSRITKILNEDYHLPISRSTLTRYVHEGVIKPDYVLERRFLFRRDRVPEIVEILKNEFREKRLNQNENQKNENNKNSSSYDSSSRTKKANSYLASVLKYLKKAD